MGMTITIPDDIARAAVDIARRTGESPENLLLDALKAHFPPLPDALRDEFDAIEQASDEDFERFEQSLVTD